MNLKKLKLLLFEPHEAIVDLESRRLIFLLSAYHLLTIPIAPILFMHRPNLPLFWIAGIFFSCVFFYVLCRSRWARITIDIQLFLALLIPAITSGVEPDRQSVHFAYMVPVLLSTLLYPLRYLYVVSGLSLTIFAVTSFIFPANDPSLNRGSLILLIVLISMVILSKHHVRWQARQRDQNKLRDQERYLALVNATFDGTAIVSNGVFSSVSEGFSKVFSTNPIELQGRLVSDFLKETLKSSEKLDTHLKLLTATNALGEQRIVQMVDETLSDGEEGKQQIMAVRDVTIEQDTSLKKLITERLTSAGMVASSIAHEMNTPLMIAQRQIELTEQAFPASPNINKRLKSASAALQQMESILGDLRWFIQSGGHGYTADPVSVIENALRLAKHRIQNGTDIQLNLPVLSPLSISSGKLTQIVINLIFNAAKARRSDQQTVRIEIDASEVNGWLTLTIKDDGCGIDARLHQRVFDPFFTSRLEEGMGLGLAICQSLVRDAKGRISLESEVGIGTCFSIELPIDDGSSIEKTQSPMVSTESLEILVIDDNEQLLDLIGQLLTPHKAKLCGSIGEAKEAIAWQQFDVILCDILMLYAGAYDLSKELGVGSEHLADKLIFTTGGPLDASLRHRLREANMPVLLKPFTRETLLEAIRALGTSKTG